MSHIFFLNICLLQIFTVMPKFSHDDVLNISHPPSTPMFGLTQTCFELH